MRRKADSRRDLQEIQRSRDDGFRSPMLGYPFPMVFSPFGPFPLEPGDFDMDSEGPD